MLTHYNVSTLYHGSGRAEQRSTCQSKCFKFNIRYKYKYGLLWFCTARNPLASDKYPCIQFGC